MDTLQARFSQVLQSELSLLARLESLLCQEQECLQRRDNTALSDNTEQKQRLVSDIEATGRERIGLLQGAGQRTDRESLLAFIRAEAQLCRQWEELESRLLRCQRQNQVNGILLERGRQQTQQVLDVLLGKGLRRESMIYDANGATSSSFTHGRSVTV